MSTVRSFGLHHRSRLAGGINDAGADVIAAGRACVHGSARRFKYGYRITLGSYGKRAEGRASGVELTEQIPVSEIDDVRVTVDPNTAPGYELAAQDGRLTWKLEPAPGEPRVLELHFHVDVPGSYDAEGL